MCIGCWESKFLVSLHRQIQRLVGELLFLGWFAGRRTELEGLSVDDDVLCRRKCLFLFLNGAL